MVPLAAISLRAHPRIERIESMSSLIMADTETRTPSKFQEVIREAGVAIDNIACSFRDGQLRISGHVRSYFEKQLAQEAIRNLPGLSLIQNDLKVRI